MKEEEGECCVSDRGEKRMDVASTTSYSLSNAKRPRKKVETVNDSDNEVLSNGKLDSKYVKEHLDCLTFLCQKFVEYDKNGLTFTLQNCDNLIDNLKMAVKQCENYLKLNDCDVDVNFILSDLEMLEDYLYSRFAWVKPMKTKLENNTYAKFIAILHDEKYNERNNVMPKFVQTDLGTEFNKFKGKQWKVFLNSEWKHESHSGQSVDWST